MTFGYFIHPLIQEVRHPLSSLNCSNHQQVSIYLGPVNIITGMADELGQEGPLGPSVSFAEGVQGIGGAVKVHDFIHKLIMGQAFKVIATLEALKYQRCLFLNFDRRAESVPFLLMFTVRTCPAQSYRSEKRNWWMALSCSKSKPSALGAISHSAFRAETSTLSTSLSLTSSRISNLLTNTDVPG